MLDGIRCYPLKSSVSGSTSNGTASQHYVFHDGLKQSYKSVETARAAEAKAEELWHVARADVNKALLDHNLALQKHYETMIKSVRQGNIGGIGKDAELAISEQQLHATTGSTSFQTKPEASFAGSGSASERNSERNSNADPKHLLLSPTNECRLSLSLATANTQFCATCGVPETRQHLCSPQHLMSEWWSATGKQNLEPLPSTYYSADQKSIEEMTTSGRTALQTGSQQHWCRPEEPTFPPLSDEPWHEV